MTKAPAGSGKGKLREPRRRQVVLPAVAAAAALGEREATVDFLKPDHVRNALTAARADYETFRREQRTWLGEGLGSLLIGIDTMYSLAAKNNGIETADAALQGSMLGAGIIRLAVEDVAISIEECRRNVATWDTAFRGIEYDEDASEADLIAFYGQETGSQFMEIATPAARTMACTIVGFACHPRSEAITSVAVD